MPGKVVKTIALVFTALCALAFDSLAMDIHTPPSVRIVGSRTAQEKTALIEAVVKLASSEVSRRFGLSLPPAVTVVLTGREGLRRFSPGEGRVRYDGIAMTWKETVAIDVESGSMVNLVSVLRHELFHLAAEPANLPRWFEEGMAMAFSGDLFPVGGPENERNAAPLTNVTPPVSGIDLLFASDDPGKVLRAYIDSHLIVQRIIKTAGNDNLAALFAERLKSPAEPFENALKNISGIDADALYRKVDAERKPSWGWRILKILWALDVFTWLAVILIIGFIIKQKRLKDAIAKSDDKPGDGMWTQ